MWLKHKTGFLNLKDSTKLVFLHLAVMINLKMQNLMQLCVIFFLFRQFKLDKEIEKKPMHKYIVLHNN